jgi:DNA polymerase III alpha subunit (gram-positive type)
MPTSGPVDFEVGQEIYVVVDVDTTGVDATPDDDLTGALSVEVSGPGGN